MFKKYYMIQLKHIKPFTAIFSFVLFFAMITVSANAQDTTVIIRSDFYLDDTAGMAFVDKDYRLELLGKKLAEFNEQKAVRGNHYGKGYRLMVISTNDRDMALKLRTFLLQSYPDQQVYMTFVNPFIKLKFGDFEDRKEADDVRKQLMNSPLITGNIYIVPETILIKGDKKEDIL